MLEESLIAAIRKAYGKSPRGPLRLGIGDDAALLRVPRGEDLALSSDALVEGVDFRRDWGTPQEIGWKAAAAALSDLAAMGARPLASLLTLVLPGSWTHREALGLIRGFADCGAKYGAPLAGGDLSSGRGVLVLDATVAGAVPRGRAWTRSGARPGDLIAVTGRLGAPAAALEGLLFGPGAEPELRKRFFRPEPRLALSAPLRRAGGVSAAMDLSDGLALDLRRLCQASGVGARVDAEALPLHPSIFRKARKASFDPVSFALGSGEEYELLLTFPPSRRVALARACAEGRVAFTVVGRITSLGRGLVLTRGGKRRALPILGYQHRT